MSLLVFRDDNVISERWTFGRYEAGGDYVDSSADGDLVLSEVRFSSHLEVTKYLHDRMSDVEWSYDIYRLLSLFEYQEKEKL